MGVYVKRLERAESMGACLTVEIEHNLAGVGPIGQDPCCPGLVGYLGYRFYTRLLGGVWLPNM